MDKVIFIEKQPLTQPSHSIPVASLPQSHPTDKAKIEETPKKKSPDFKAESRSSLPKNRAGKQPLPTHHAKC